MESCDGGRNGWRLPPFHVILPWPYIEVMIPRVVFGSILRSLSNLSTRVVLQLRDVDCGMPSLEDGICSSTLLLAVPRKMLSQ